MSYISPEWAKAPVFVPNRQPQDSAEVRVPIPQVHDHVPQVEPRVHMGGGGFRASAPEFIPSRRYERYVAWRDTAIVQENGPQVVPGAPTGPQALPATPRTTQHNFPDKKGNQYPTKGSRKKAGGVTAIPNPMETVSAPAALQIPWTPAPSRLPQATLNTSPPTTTPPTRKPPATMDSPTMLTVRSLNTSVSTPQQGTNRNSEFCPVGDCRWNNVLSGLTPDRRSRVLSNVSDEEIDHILEHHALQLRPLDLTPEGAAPPLASDAWEGASPHSSPTRGFAGLSTLLLAQDSSVGRHDSVCSSFEGAKQTVFNAHRERVLDLIGGVAETSKAGILFRGEEERGHEARPIDMNGKKDPGSSIKEQVDVVPQRQTRARAYTLVNPPSTSRAASHRRSISIHGKQNSFIFLPFRLLFFLHHTSHTSSHFRVQHG
jgi:hypothetical protein